MNNLVIIPSPLSMTPTTAPNSTGSTGENQAPQVGHGGFPKGQFLPKDNATNTKQPTPALSLEDNNPIKRRVNKPAEQQRDVLFSYFYLGIIYKDLLDFSKHLQHTQMSTNPTEESVSVSTSKRVPLTRQDSVCMSPRKGLPSAANDKSDRDPQTGKGIVIVCSND
ncbi:hypothetical protein PR048_021610 [Dryococelus australis]|uniref:Uncharacterized protein n=1 Tax=Dryococelus australis TaxID=614101 RepID=A0ABQ9GYN5_9NEOP|nr:hypothetical protein PR048_021610 [Dryococelus australis]